MCGIAGIFHSDPQRAVDRAVLDRMTSVLAHRGPDDAGLHTDGPLGLGFRRLSIIDLSPAGHQPMSNEDGSLWLVCNGEIYNFVELRDTLRAKGHVFKSATDVEVILHGYEEWGGGVLDKLDGMFAMALWDAKRRELLLARDRFGIKPLHYAVLPEGLVFGSEIKALLACPDTPRRLDPAALWNYLSLAKVAAPETIFLDIRKLLPGHAVTCRDGIVSHRRFYELPRERPLRPSVAEAADETLRLLEAAVRTHLVADVPVGCFLSGGLDSSLIATLAAKHVRKPLQTFSITFEDSPAVDESRYQKIMAERLQTEHHVVRARTEMTELVPAMLYATDEPFAIASFMPLYHLSRLTRQHVKVVLSGDGGDELYAGYDRRYTQPERRRWLRGFGLLLGAAADRDRIWENRTPVERLRRRAGLAGLPEFERYLSCHSRYRDLEKCVLLQPDLLAAARNADDRFARESYDEGLATSLERRLRLEFITQLPDEMLTKVDRATSAFGLEGRVPFLDRSLAEYAWSVNPAVHWLAGQGKQVLRAAGGRILPSEVVYRPKGGFTVPLSRWLKDDPSFMRPLLLEPMQEFDAIVRPAAVRAMLAAQDGGRGEHGEHLWLLYVLKSWLALKPFSGSGTKAGVCEP